MARLLQLRPESAAAHESRRVHAVGAADQLRNRSGDDARDGAAPRRRRRAKAALGRPRAKPLRTTAREIKDQAAAALAKLGLSTPSPRNSGYDGSLSEPGRDAAVFQHHGANRATPGSLSDEKVKNQSKSSFQRVKDRVQEGRGLCLMATGRCERTSRGTAPSRPSTILTERIIGGCGERTEAEKTGRGGGQGPNKVDAHVGLRAMHSKDDAPSPPSKLGQAKEKLLRTGSLFASTMTRAAKELKEKAKKAAGRSPTEKVDQRRACSGGGRVAASTYVQRAHLQYDTLSTEGRTGACKAQHGTRRRGLLGPESGTWLLRKPCPGGCAWRATPRSTRRAPGRHVGAGERKV